MTNFKALGIEKEMQQCFEDIDATELQKLMNSCYFDYPHITNRKKGSEYCTIMVMSCKHESWWYNDLIGLEFFCKIEYKDYGRGRFISNFQGVKLTNTKEIWFRCFEPEDVIII
jgi:hypothetical protein